MKIESIGLDRLLAHPANANVMREETLRKLRRHIEKQGYYEPLTVRRHPTKPNCFELLNGHHRKQVLEQLGYKQAECVVWQVDDEQALLLLATLNRLSGQDDVYKRAELLESLSQRFGQEELIKQLPEKRGQLEKLLAVRKPPTVLAPELLPEAVQAMTFFVTGEQKEIITQALRTVRAEVGGDDPENRLTKGDLLALVAEAYVKQRKQTQPQASKANNAREIRQTNQ